MSLEKHILVVGDTVERQKIPLPLGVRARERWQGSGRPMGAGAAEELGPGSRGLESQAEVQGPLLRVRGPWELGTPGQICVWETVLGAHAEEGKEGNRMWNSWWLRA